MKTLNRPVPAAQRLLQPDFSSETTGNTTSWLRGTPEPDGLDAGKYHVAEIQEQRFDDRNRMIQAFNRGDLDYIPKLLPWEVDAFLASDFQVKKYSLPMTHVLIFNPPYRNALRMHRHDELCPSQSTVKAFCVPLCSGMNR